MNHKYFRSKFLLYLLLVCSFSKANNFNIWALTYSQAMGTVSFNFSWDNSWNTGTTWDAAWIFVKFRDCSGPATFTHALVNSTYPGTHSFPAGITPVLSDGSAVGIDASPNNTGVLVRRIAGTGTTSGAITLQLTNLPAAGNLDIRIYGVEMVFVPVGSYSIGNSPGSGQNEFCVQSIANENANTITAGAGCPTSYNLTANFPKGYAGFHMMKYEISQGQYADFLQCINLAARYPGMFGTNRFTINAAYTATRPDRACNFLGWADVSAYLDWAALRPLTELQYEKAARGGSPVVTNEFAWGSAAMTCPASAGISGAENGTEQITTVNANCAAGNLVYTSGDNGSGPLRVGIFATPASFNRQATGGSYWGIFDLTGNVTEFYIHSNAGVSPAVSSTGLSFGDGYLDNAGNHDVADWPSATTPGTNIIRRGGSWNASCGSSTLFMTNRNQGTAATRDNLIGGRGGR